MWLQQSFRRVWLLSCLKLSYQQFIILWVLYWNTLAITNKVFDYWYLSFQATCWKILMGFTESPEHIKITLKPRDEREVGKILCVSKLSHINFVSPINSITTIIESFLKIQGLAGFKFSEISKEVFSLKQTPTFNCPRHTDRQKSNLVCSLSPNCLFLPWMVQKLCNDEKLNDEIKKLFFKTDILMIIKFIWLST